jgi:hypothetical protein
MKIKDLKNIINQYDDEMDILITVDPDMYIEDEIFALGTFSKKIKVTELYLDESIGDGIWKEKDDIINYNYDNICDEYDVEDFDDEIINDWLSSKEKKHGILIEVIPG